MTAAYFDPGNAEIRSNPYPTYERLRREDPVHWSEPLQSWVLTRYEHVKRVSLDRRFSANRLQPFFERQSPQQRARIPDLIRYLTEWLVFRDPPSHTRLRKLVNKAFTTRAVRRRRPRIESICASLVDSLHTVEETDLIADFAGPLPALVIMDLIGVPIGQFDELKAWSDDVALFVGSSRVTEDKYTRAQSGAEYLAALFTELLEARRKHPDDDLMSALVAAREGGQLLTEDEVVGTCILLLFAGHETTTHLIGNAMLALMRQRHALHQLQRDPALIPVAVEELLRYDGPVTSLPRVVADDHRLEGVELRTGNRVFAMLSAANRDPTVFPNPDAVEIGRTPNRHIGFGHGIHLCSGAALARLEAEIALRQLIERFPNIEPATETLNWMDSIVFRGVEALPVRGLS